MPTTVPCKQQSHLDAAFDVTRHRVGRLIERDPDRLPVYTCNGRWQWLDDTRLNACAGFLPGILWMLHERTGQSRWRDQARRYCGHLKTLEAATGPVQRGFIHAAAMTPNGETIDPADDGNTDHRRHLQAWANTLANAFQPAGNYIPSDDDPGCLSIETLFILPLLIRVAGDTGDERLLDIACRHCATSRRFLIRGDGSTAEQAVFDPRTGQYRHPRTQHGWRDDSCWARGQAWAIYGLARCGRMMDFEPWLDSARQCARAFIEKCGTDPIPPWDFEDPAADPPRDATAAAIAAVGLFELAEAVQTVGTDQAQQRRYHRETAMRILERLCSPDYLAGDDADWEGILKNGVFDHPARLGINESTIPGDYFFLRALTYVQS